jgi:hypothetical protein
MTKQTKKNQSSDGKPQDLRSWSVLPARFVGDRRLSPNDIQVLAALGLYTNQAGVCWPTIETLERFTKIGRHGIMAASKRLQQLGYIRLLKPEYFPGQKSKWLTNRYQVLWRSPNDPIPKYEDLRDATLYNPTEPEPIDKAQEQPQATYNDRVLKGVAAAFNRVLSRYGSFADEALAIRDAPAFLESLSGGDVDQSMLHRTQEYMHRKGSLPTRLSLLVAPQT